MKIGTKSVLFGAHQFLIHPWFVAAAWWKLYGFPWDPRLWIAFFVHDLGYLGKPNMDGEEGEAHVFLGAKIMGALFDRRGWRGDWDLFPRIFDWVFGRRRAGTASGDVSWYCFSFYHSRFMAKRYGITPSRLCFADKIAIALEPWWFYIPRVRLTGEIKEYRDENRSKSNYWDSPQGSDKEWFLACQSWCRKWVAEHVGGKADGWTPARRIA